MLKKKFTKTYNDSEEGHYIYIGVLQALTGMRITDQEKRVLAIILKEGKIDKSVKDKLSKIASKPRIENIISKFRKKKILVGDVPSDKFLKLETELTINLVNGRN